MFDMQAADILTEMLQFFKEAKPLLENPDKIDEVIAGVAQAKETLARKDEVVALIDKSNALITESAERKQEAEDAEASLADAKNDLAARENQLRTDRSLIQPTMDQNKKDAAANEERSTDLDKRAETIAEREATIIADLESAAEAKKKAQERLAVLNQVPEEK